MVFDSHCHLHDDIVRDDVATYLARAHAAGVHQALLAGVEPAGWVHERELVERHQELFAAIGVHPQWITGKGAQQIDHALRDLEDTFPAHRRFVALGETGLDGAPGRKDSLELQEVAFRAQLRLAKKFDCPLVLHILDAHGRALEVLAEEGLPDAGGVVHSCSASADVTQEYVKMGLFISFAGAIAHPKARRVREAAKVVPSEKLLVETDAPFQTPFAHRPGINEPAFLVAVVDALAHVLGCNAGDLGVRTAENARKLFGVEDVARVDRNE